MPATTRRTRKSTTSKAKVQSKVISAKTVTKYTEPSQNETMTESPERPNRPTPTLLTLKMYKDDFIARMQIHNYEVNELLRDLNAGVKFITPYVKKGVAFSQDAYQQILARLETQPETVETN